MFQIVKISFDRYEIVETNLKTWTEAYNELQFYDCEETAALYCIEEVR